MKNLLFSLLALVLFSSISSLSFENLSSNSFPFLQEDPYLAFAEEMPEPIGGLEAIYKRISYPEIAKKAGLEGKVYLLIYVNENGGVDDVKVVKGLGGGCEEEATKAVKESKYKPGKNKGTPVKVKLSLAINFKLKF